MKKDAIIELFPILEKLMYGYNYEVSFGMEVFGHCDSIENFRVHLKNIFPESTPGRLPEIAIANHELIDMVQACFNYQGEDGTRSGLNPEQDDLLKKASKIYFSYLSALLKNCKTVYAYPDSNGIPGYPVWWGFRFVIFSKNGECHFCYGAASD